MDNDPNDATDEAFTPKAGSTAEAFYKDMMTGAGPKGFPPDAHVIVGNYMPADAPTNVFEGKPDGRQSQDTKTTVSRFSPVYRALSQDEKDFHDAFKAKAEELAQMIDQLEGGRLTALAHTSLEQSVMWAIKQLTSTKK